MHEGVHIGVLRGDQDKVNADVLFNLMDIQISQIIGIIRKKGRFYYQIRWINL